MPWPKKQVHATHYEKILKTIELIEFSILGELQIVHGMVYAILYSNLSLGMVLGYFLPLPTLSNTEPSRGTAATPV